MGVAGEADQPLALGQGGLQNSFPLYAVAIPGIEVVRNLAGFGEESLLLRREIAEGGASGELLKWRGVLVEQGWIAGVEKQFGR